MTVNQLVEALSKIVREDASNGELPVRYKEIFYGRWEDATKVEIITTRQNYRDKEDSGNPIATMVCVYNP